MLFGLEVLQLKQTDINKLAIQQRKFLKQIQTLPDRAPSVVTHALLGLEPVESYLDRQVLTLYRQVLDPEGTVEKELALRLLSMKNERSHSWFIKVKETLSKYDLPSIYDLVRRNCGRSL